MNYVCAALLFTSLGTSALADFKLAREGQPTVTLTFRENFTAAIIDQDRPEPLLEGRTKLDAEGNLVIDRERGDCPSAVARRDSQRGDRTGYEIVILDEPMKTPALGGACPRGKVQGRYERAE